MSRTLFVNLTLNVILRQKLLRHNNNSTLVPGVISRSQLSLKNEYYELRFFLKPQM